MNAPQARGLPPGRLVVPALAGIVGAVGACVWLGLGLLSLPGLGLLAGVAVVGTVGALWWAPAVPALLIPAILPLPQVRVFFPFELLLGAFAGLVLVHGLRRGTTWAWRLRGVEVANASLILWALFSGFWCWDGLSFFLGARRMVVGWAALWTASRLPRVARREWFDTGLVACALSLSLSALGHRIASGLSTQAAIVERASATDLGWGTANYIASLLLILAPPVFVIAQRHRHAALRFPAWLALLAIAALQTLVASRAATVLFFAGIGAMVLFSLRRGRLAGMLLLLLAMTVAILTPYGQALLLRFSNARDLGSMVLRIWYFREAWHRTVDFLPWGMGLNQGLVYPDHLAGTDTHNYWLSLSSELGVPGVVLWTAVLALLYRQILRLQRMPGRRADGLALAVAFWLAQLHTLVEPTFQGVQYQFLFFWVLGAILAYGAARADGEPFARSISVR